MSIISAIKHRLGLSVTPANNFVLDASADNGTMKLARESGQDIMTVDAAGKVAFPQLPAANGYAKLPGGLQVCWGSATTPAGDGVVVTFPIAFGSAPRVVASFANSTGVAVSITVGNTTTSQTVVFAQNSASGVQIAAAFNWIAIGLAP